MPTIFPHHTINSLLKIDKLRFREKEWNTSSIGMNESKQNTSILSSEAEIEGHDLLHLCFYKQ